MTEQILVLLEQAGTLIRVAAAVIVGGFVLATLRYALRFRRLGRSQNLARFKSEPGHPIMIALDILILANVIMTISVTRTFESLAFLASIVAIRTVVSWTLTLEIEGRWRWQTADAEEREHA